MTSDKTKEELERDLAIRDTVEHERELSDQRYAIKLVERIVFAACGLVLVAVITAIIAMVVSK